MKEIHFIVYLDGINEMSDDIVDSLFEAGCDGVPGMREGKALIHFVLDADSIDAAVFEALQIVEKAGLNFAAVEIDPKSLHELYDHREVA